MCEQSIQVHRYHDGYLTAQARDELDQHMATCVECAALLADLRGLSRVLSAAPRAQLPAGAVQRMIQSRRSARDRGVLRIATWLTAAAASIVLATLLTQPAQQPPVREATASAALWQTRAVMPPDEMDNSSGELLVVAQWMTDELGAEAR